MANPNEPTKTQRLGARLAPLAAGWFAFALMSLAAVVLGRGSRVEHLYRATLEGALAWMATSIWTDLHCRYAWPAAAGRALGRCERAADRVLHGVARFERHLFPWSPLLLAVSWSLYGAHLAVAPRSGRVPLLLRPWPDTATFTYFVIAMLLMAILQRGIGDQRDPPHRGR